MKTLYIGETNSADSKLYYEIDESACNLHIGNYKTALEEKPAGVFYTSLSDFQNENHTMVQTCLLFDEIIYRPPAVWTKDPVRQQTEEFLQALKFSQTKKTKMNWIVGDNDANIVTANDIFANSPDRKTKNPQIWVAGCSFSEAVGVEDDEKWGTLLANKLNMPVNILAEGASGNSYQARKLLSADIRENDIVIFQITTPHRETIFHPKYGQLHVNSRSFEIISDLYKLYTPDRLDDPTIIINQIKDIQNVVNFLQKTKTKFLLWSPGIWLPMGKHLTEHFLEHKEYFYYNVCKMADVGTDGIHPGPETHKQYADFVFEKFKLQEE